MPLVQFRGGDYFMLFLAKNPPRRRAGLFISCGYFMLLLEYFMLSRPARERRRVRRRVSPFWAFSFDHHFCLTGALHRNGQEQAEFVASMANRTEIRPAVGPPNQDFFCFFHQRVRRFSSRTWLLLQTPASKKVWGQDLNKTKIAEALPHAQERVGPSN